MSPSFFVRKPKSPDPRFVVDYSAVNMSVKRKPQLLFAPEKVWNNVKAGSKWFVKMDLSSGYWQVPLDEESSKLTTFLCESGLFRYKRMPMGMARSSDEFLERMLEKIVSNEELTHLVHEVDDLLLACETLEQLEAQFEILLKICQQYNFTLSPKKLEVAGPDEHLVFAGLRISAEGAMPDPEKVAAL